MAWLCGKYHLPVAGGLYDQDYTLMTRMRYLSSIYTTIQYMRGLTGEAINTDLSTAQRLLLGDLVEMGISLGGING